MSGHYEKDGIKFPRCTEVISDSTNKSNGLVQWSSNEAVGWIRENCDSGLGNTEWCYVVTDADLEAARYAYKDTSRIALDVGSEVHNTIEKHLRGIGHIPSSPQAITAFDAFLEWKSKNNLEVIALEQTVWGDRWAGTLDFWGYYKDKLYVIDWKTSKAFYPEMRYQVAAYRSAVERDAFEQEALIPEGCGVLMLDKETGMPKFKDTSKTYLKDLETFNAMVSLYYLKHKLIAKRFLKGE